MRTTVSAVALGIALAGLSAAGAETYTTELVSFQEVPAISSGGEGTVTVDVDEAAKTLHFELEYSGLEGNVTQAHLHFAQAGVNGGIFAFFCSNLGNGPAGTSACPGSGSVEGTISKDDLVNANSQGLTGDDDELFARVLAALRAGVVYANVHSDLFPGGEIRGQLAEAPPAGLCTTDGNDLCLRGRFRVRAHFMTQGGVGGNAVAGQLTPDTGYFYFFNGSNIEIMVKVLNGCGVTGRYWVFAAGLTNVETELDVVDLQTGAETSYLNPQMTPFEPILDTGALNSCP